MPRSPLSPLSRLLWRHQMALATGLTVVLAVAGFSLTHRLTERAGLERLTELGVERLELYAGSLEAEITRLAHVPALVALGDEVAAVLEGDAGAESRVQRRLAQINAQAGSLLIAVVDRAGKLRLFSASEAPSVLETARLESIAAALVDGQSGFFSSNETSTDYFHAAPVRRGDRVLGQVMVRINLAPLEATWVGLGQRSRGEKLLVVDRQDVVTLSSVPAWKYRRFVEGFNTQSWAEMPRHLSLHYPPQGRDALRWESRGEASAGSMLWQLQAPEGDRARDLPTRLLVQERPMMAWGLRLMTLSDPTEVWRDAGRAAWGGGALGALLGLLGIYYLFRRRAMIQLARARDALEREVEERTQALSQANAELTREIEQRLRAEDELVQAGKLAVLGQLSAGVAHEVNQPLTALRALSANSQRFLEAGKLEAVQRNLVNIEAAVERMARITSQLKSFSRRSGTRHERVNLAQAVANARVLLEHRLREAQVQVDEQVEVTLHVHCDGTRLEQVLVNLIGNAVDAMETAPARRLGLRAWTQGARIFVAVSDTGAGLSAEARARLFEPFFTTKPAGQGLGLGLVISAQIVREFGGMLVPWPGESGMEFRFDLPAAHDEGR
ncbi:sensor histidine kinase [Inhella gelatinilytica]|uniref:C4-dicarboxylate transport sensor protein DctB n=1 Tax=Inhella gelatinilytica TaxID=2795030 RepID=A0A931IU53_9BURK|nr:ATP-binding protein [Inhella gelatinilytica]MBH9552790.1 sensor histidine kinase [Inhella gelatinilytica]